MQYYLFLTIAICGELAGTTFLKYSEGFTKLTPTIICLVSYLTCFYFFSRALTGINLSIAYATWCALGIVAATCLSVFLFKEEISLMGIIGTIVIIVGVVIVNFAGPSH